MRGILEAVVRQPRRVARVAAVGGLLVTVGVLAPLAPAAGAAVCAVVMLAGVMLASRARFGEVDLSGQRFRWLPVAWAFVLIQPIGHFTAGRTQLTAVSGNPSVENVLNLGIFGLIAALSLLSLRRHRLSPWPSPLLLALPLLALTSSAWSLAATVTLGFSFMLISTVLMATLTAAIVRADPELGGRLVRRSLRFFVLGVAALCVIGLLIRGDWYSQTDVPRFTWPGTDSLLAAAEVGLAFLIVLFAGRRDALFSGRASFALLVLFGACVFLAKGRTILAGLAVAVLLGYWLSAGGAGNLRRLLGLLAIAAVVVALVMSFNGALSSYLSRGENQQQLTSLNGRTGVWSLTISQLHSPGRWLVGYGLSGSRVLLANSIQWAGDAHSAWVETLLSLGLLGVTIGAALLAVLAVRLFRGPPGVLSSRVLAIVYVYILVMSPVATGFAAPGPEPGMAYTLLSLCFAATAVRVGASVPVRPGPRAAPSGWEPALRPAPA